MINCSDAFKELMSTNIRPKCEPTITVYGTQADGTEVELVWSGKDITSMKYKRSIDPVGRELPAMDLTWTEIYDGKLNAAGYPEKYNNIVKYMAVKLSFSQDLVFRNTWEVLHNTNTTWKSLFDTNTSWKELKSNVKSEIITMPIMFLSARPTIKGSTITWEAKDLLYFLDDTQARGFLNGASYHNIMAFFMLNNRGSYLQSPNLFNAITNTATKVLSRYGGVGGLMVTDRMIYTGATKNLLLNLATAMNEYWIFKGDTAILKGALDRRFSSGYSFTGDIMNDYPTATINPGISSYQFKYYVCTKDEAGVYQKEPDDTIQDNGLTFYRYNFKGNSSYIENDVEILQELNTATLGSPSTLTVYPVALTANTETLDTGNEGEPFIEDNPVNRSDKRTGTIKSRLYALERYFTPNTTTLAFECLANPALEPDDVVQIETNLYGEDGERIIKNAIVVSSEITYNGALSEKITAHEVSI